MACPTPEAIPAQELPTTATAASEPATGSAVALSAEEGGVSVAPTALTAQPVAEIEPPCAG